MTRQSSIKSSNRFVSLIHFWICCVIKGKLMINGVFCSRHLVLYCTGIMVGIGYLIHARLPRWISYSRCCWMWNIILVIFMMLMHKTTVNWEKNKVSQKLALCMPSVPKWVFACNCLRALCSCQIIDLLLFGTAALIWCGAEFLFSTLLSI